MFLFAQCSGRIILFAATQVFSCCFSLEDNVLWSTAAPIEWMSALLDAGEHWFT